MQKQPPREIETFQVNHTALRGKTSNFATSGKLDKDPNLIPFSERGVRSRRTIIQGQIVVLEGPQQVDNEGMFDH